MVAGYVALFVVGTIAVLLIPALVLIAGAGKHSK